MLAGLGRRVGADRHRSLERSDRRPERLDHRFTGVDPARHERGDHLRVGGDLGRDREVVQGDEVGEVVDVTVERRGDVRVTVTVRSRVASAASSWFSGCALASEMIPTLAQRVCPRTMTWADVVVEGADAAARRS